jgi:hypothetical protein
MKVIPTLLLVAVALVAAAAVAIRVWPVDVARWHVDPGAPGFRPGANWAVFCPDPGTRGFSTAPLGPLVDIALATPRTRVLAGSVGEGRITFVTRSRVMGFPDFTTAAVVQSDAGPRVCLYARQGIGEYDWGVNAARVRDWAGQLTGLRDGITPAPTPPG